LAGFGLLAPVFLAAALRRVSQLPAYSLSFLLWLAHPPCLACLSQSIDLRFDRSARGNLRTRTHFPLGQDDKDFAGYM
jgi:hypothetical protein